jgi:hypothetical protein
MGGQPAYYVRDDDPGTTLWRVFAPGEFRWTPDTGWQPSTQVMDAFFGRDDDGTIGFGSAVYTEITPGQAEARYPDAFR